MSSKTSKRNPKKTEYNKMSPRKQQVMNEDEINTRNNTPFLMTLPRSYSVMID